MDADRTLQALYHSLGEVARSEAPAGACAGVADAAAAALGDPRERTAESRLALQGVARLAALALERDRTHSVVQRLEDGLLKAQRLESVGRLAGVVAHDYNNLLTAMVGYMDLVAAGFPPGAEEQGWLAQALDAADQATELSRLLLAFARRRPVPPAPQDMNGLVRQLVPQVKRLLPGGVKLEVSASAARPWFLADAGQVELAIINLALCARDAMPGGGTLALSATDVAGDPACVAVVVGDTGEGMDADVLRRAVEPFVAAGEEGRAAHLSITAALVRASGGRLEAGAGAAGGTNVRALWPVIPPPEVAAG